MSVVANQLLFLNQVSPSQARNAYSGLILVPGFEQLRFSVFLSQVRKEWNQTNAKYGAFWDATSVIQSLATEPLDMGSVEKVRERLIWIWKLCHLYRSIDLERTLRTISQVGDTFYVLCRRKGAKAFAWEPVIDNGLPEGVNPLKLLKHYVRMTRHCGSPGGPLLLALVAPFGPIKANTIGSITKRLLEKFGVATGVWGPHSTRGAGVGLYKTLGLSSETVCEIGKWKNFGAFQSHYLRLGAAKDAGKALATLVHNVSPWGSAEPDWSRTPGKKLDQGGSDQEGEALSQGETRFLLPANCS